MKREMTLEQARGLISEVVANRIRWGKHAGTGQYSMDQVLDALVLVAQADNERITGRDEEITKLNRQLAAANARETKLRNDLKDTKAAGKDLTARVQFLVDSWPEPLEDGCITFPDGESWPAQRK